RSDPAPLLPNKGDEQGPQPVIRQALHLPDGEGDVGGQVDVLDVLGDEAGDAPQGRVTFLVLGGLTGVDPRLRVQVEDAFGPVLRDVLDLVLKAACGGAEVETSGGVDEDVGGVGVGVRADAGGAQDTVAFEDEPVVEVSVQADGIGVDRAIGGVRPSGRQASEYALPARRDGP